MQRTEVGRQCPLCDSQGVTFFSRIGDAHYYRCLRCELTFIDPARRPTPADEVAHYQHHENDPADPRYRGFLSRLSKPLLEHLPPEGKGLDYGSGPGPTLSLMLEEQGYEMNIYDPFFAPERDVLERTYDFITCTETAEHFFQPGREFRLLDSLLRPEGWLGVMTQVLSDDIVFEEWRYARDPTHVCFYRKATMEWIADQFDWSLHMPAPNVFLFQKAAAAEVVSDA